MILKAVKKWDININKSFMIGDKITDKSAAKSVNLKFNKYLGPSRYSLKTGS